MVDVVADLNWRGLISQSTDIEALQTAFNSGPVTFYCGFDPTAASLHVGHLVQLITMRRLQRAGHKPIALVGGATGLIGDPRMSGERVLNSPEIVRQWASGLHEQISRFLDFDGENAAQMVNNLDWTAELSAIEFLRDFGKHYRLGTMLTKDTVARRLESDAGISFAEFSYQILQGIDFLELHRRYGCKLQTGGNDQWGNLLSGVDLIRRADRATVHAMTTPLLTKADGTKFGKSESGDNWWLNAELTSPYAFYQFWLNTDDRDIITYVKAMSERSRAEIEELEEQTAQRPHERAAQRALAEELTTLVHGEQALAHAQAASAALFGRGDLTLLPHDVLAAAAHEVPSARIGRSELGQTTAVELLVAAGLAQSKGAARRNVADGGVSVNNETVQSDPGSGARAVAPPITEADLLHNRWVVVRRGRRNVAIIEVRD
ncbi:MAG TPA: tyrosine--tRNA ligase [Actinomycetales bacterium]|nr:tyrosine--tRNA ligase [Actinomycetales bacterium]